MDIQKEELNGVKQNRHQSLAVKWRPHKFEDVVEQGYVKQILENQIKNNEIKNAYLFCGGAGTGKTTTARIFANEINNGIGNPIEVDAASNNRSRASKNYNR